MLFISWQLMLPVYFYSTHTKFKSIPIYDNCESSASFSSTSSQLVWKFIVCYILMPHHAPNVILLYLDRTSRQCNCRQSQPSLKVIWKDSLASLYCSIRYISDCISNLSIIIVFWFGISQNKTPIPGKLFTGSPTFLYNPKVQ